MRAGAPLLEMGVSFDDALEAMEAGPDYKASGSPAVAIVAPLVDVSPPNDVNFRQTFGHGSFGYEPFIGARSCQDLPDCSPELCSMKREVAAELNLTGAATAERLNQLRRDFMWRNHPDRRPDLSAQQSNARVAIANMLIDRALEDLSPRRRGST